MMHIRRDWLDDQPFNYIIPIWGIDDFGFLFKRQEYQRLHTYWNRYFDRKIIIFDDTIVYWKKKKRKKKRILLNNPTRM